MNLPTNPSSQPSFLLRLLASRQGGVLLFILACCLAIFAPAASAQLPSITITATDAAAGERLAGQAPNPGNIRITRTGSTAAQLTVYIKAISGTATRGTDYEFGIPITTWVPIPAGSSSVDIAVNVLDDWLTEGAETVRIDVDSETGIGTPAPYTISGASRATVNIADNEDPLAPLRAIPGWFLAGHTHGGQVRIPPFPPPVLPVANRRYAAGAVDLGGERRLYVNRGVGHLTPLRFGVRPEVTVFTLTPA